MTPPKIKPTDGRAAVDAVRSSLIEPVEISRDTLAMAVRYLLQRFEQQYPGHTVEVRVPPFGAVQAVEGPRHTRGTPPNVVELGADSWIALATGDESWDALAVDGRISASGTRSNISDLLPLAEW